jgi:hypothetical protein
MNQERPKASASYIQLNGCKGGSLKGRNGVPAWVSIHDWALFFPIILLPRYMLFVGRSGVSEVTAKNLHASEAQTRCEPKMIQLSILAVL